MPNNPNQPTEYDAVLGGSAPPPVSGVVLGGLEGVKKRWKSAVVEQRMAALEEAIKYGEASIELVLEALQDESEEIQRTAYRLLGEKTEPRVKQALQQVNYWKLMTCLRSLEGHSGEVNSVAISPDAKTFVSGSDDETIKVWEMHTGTLLRTLRGHSAWVTSLAISPDSKTVVSGSDDKSIKVWEMHTGNLLRTLKGHSGWVNSIAISPDGKTVVSGSRDATIKLWGV